MKLSFKKGARNRGLMAAAMESLTPTLIKANGSVCGYIHPPSIHQINGTWSVRLMVRDGENNFRNILLKYKSKTEGGCRDFQVSLL